MSQTIPVLGESEAQWGHKAPVVKSQIRAPWQSAGALKSP